MFFLLISLLMPDWVTHAVDYFQTDSSKCDGSLSFRTVKPKTNQTNRAII